MFGRDEDQVIVIPEETVRGAPYSPPRKRVCEQFEE
jgi:hypothetical protein